MLIHDFMRHNVRIQSVHCGFDRLCVLTKQGGEVYTIGDGEFGTMGDGKFMSVTQHPQCVAALKHATIVYLRTCHKVVLARSDHDMMIVICGVVTSIVRSVVCAVVVRVREWRITKRRCVCRCLIRSSFGRM